ncbi:hypothetical protein [Aeoliella mucimassa]|uniref:Uncharacterized protein n=1 Tax=Aeoliella mucimassa TaxID=2527972 RepID=A0A518AQ98_9BACT|nr:hypothetical protein [Aeoliella mucimassa]QDU56895.1 hypothetical protein Pan181_31070 [Aeoliella mucimassa]
MSLLESTDVPPESPALKPSKMHVLLSVLVLLGSLSLAAASLAALLVTWDVCSVISGAIFLPFPLVVSYLQYRGVFGYPAKSAMVAAGFLLVAGGFSLFVFTSLMKDFIVAGAEMSWIMPLLPMLCIGLICIGTGWLNIGWARTLESQPEVVAVTGKGSGKGLLVAVLMMISVLLMTLYFHSSTPPEYAEHVAAKDVPFGLPSNARDVSYCQGVRGIIALEFSTDEDTFVDWFDSGIGSLESEAAHIPVKPIGDKYTITRYYRLTLDLVGPNSITLTDGLYYQWNKEDRGVYAAYDRQTGRAYYYAHYH